MTSRNPRNPIEEEQARAMSPLRLLAYLLLVLFLAEGLIMLALPFLFGKNAGYLKDFADPLLLVMISAPFIWTLIVRPLRDAVVKEKIWVEALLERVVDGVVMVDERGTIKSCNKAAEAMFGYGVDEIAGKHLSTLFSESGDFAAWIEGFHSTGAHPDEVSKSREYEGCRKDGNCFPMDVSMSMVSLAGENMFIGIIRDLSERKEMEKQLIRSENNACVAVVAGSIGHELNNSATTLMGYAELLSAKPHDANLSARVAEIYLSQSVAMASHAANLLQMGKPREPVFEPVFLPDFLSKLTSVLKESGVLKRLKVVESHDAGQPSIRGDKGLLEQVFRNLEINGAQAMGSSGTLTVISAADPDGFVRVEVIDTGVGILPEFMPQVFEPFRTTKGAKGGTGLGMYIAKKVVIQHGGDIAVESEYGNGTKVTVRFPTTGDHAQSTSASVKSSTIGDRRVGDRRKHPAP